MDRLIALPFGNMISKSIHTIKITCFQLSCVLFGLQFCYGMTNLWPFEVAAQLQLQDNGRCHTYGLFRQKLLSTTADGAVHAISSAACAAATLHVLVGGVCDILGLVCYYP